MEKTEVLRKLAASSFSDACEQRGYASPCGLPAMAAGRR